ncbi:transport protein particle component [Fistulina hepatica ATCC 64428]|uniref:Transport protein particle component n=1 Tax=Fistulina hepatica ATCC 64428 TaxID=1128425 RepID=A0A0D7APL2_9AGAR|nr:transport protein particle component [Fistulina hepatica ATCC 64428]
MPALNLSALADPPTALIDGAVMDYFLIELVETLRASSGVAVAREKKLEQSMVAAGLIPPPPAPLKKGKDKQRDSVPQNPAPSAEIPDEEEEALRARLENIGMHVGGDFAERLCRDKPLFSDTLDAIKFVCKDVWPACWDKQVDNLRTNHRGVYVLQDNAFKPVTKISSWDGRADAVKRAKVYVMIPAGIIRGTLSRLGLNAIVTPEITSLPQCTFQIKLPKGS